MGGKITRMIMKRSIPKLLFLCALSLCNLAFGKDFGPRGQVFPIEEESLLEFLQKKFSDQRANIFSSSSLLNLAEKAKTPVPVNGLGPAKETRSFLLDISFKLEKDIKDETGAIIAKAGTIINPLAKMKLSSGLLFIDGSNKTHLAWARQQTGHFKWILTNGQPIKIEEQEKKPVYFDQGGIYTSRFRIEHVPAKVIQKDHFLLVEEISIKESS